MFTLIAAVISAIVGLVTKGLGTQREQEIEITEGYINDRGYEQSKTIASYQIFGDKKRAELIVLGLLIIGIFVVSAIILLRKNKVNGAV